MIDAHYSQLRDLPPSSSHYSKLRAMMDSVEKHLRSLESLGEDIKNNMIVSLLKSKLPKIVITRLEENKDDGNIPWDLDTLRKVLNKFIMAQEAGERQMKFNNPSYSEEEKPTPIQRKYFNNKYTTGALHTGSKQRSCIYCGENHWNDECTVYPDIESRKKKLIGHCYICLRRGHMVHECNVTKECIYCKKKRSHHRSLCGVQFPM